MERPDLRPGVGAAGDRALHAHLPSQPGGFGMFSPQTNGYQKGPGSPPMDRDHGAKSSAKALYEQRKNYARDSASGLPETSQYRVEHLTTFVLDRKDAMVTVEDGIRKLRLLDAKGKVWTQDMILQVDARAVSLLDLESKNELENFPFSTVQQCQAVTGACTYDSVLALVCKEPAQSKPDLHLFQCDEVKAPLVCEDIDSAMSDSKGGKHRRRPETLRMIAKAEPGIPPPPRAPAPAPPGTVTQVDVRSRVAAWSAWAADRGQERRLLPYPMEETPEVIAAHVDRDVQILNHVLDDIEFFITKLQKAAEAFSELARRKKSKKSKRKAPGEGVLTLRAKPPPADEFVDCFQKFKHGFNLLAKLQAHIQNPSAAELVHFLFTPLQMVVQATGGPELASSVLSPLLARDTLDFLSRTVTPQERGLWLSLGDAWLKARAEWPRDQFIPPYAPRFRHGWEPPALPVPEAEALGPEPPGLPDPYAFYSSVHARGPRPDQGEAAVSPARQADRGCEPQPAAPRRLARCRYEFTARNSSELSVLRDEVLEVLDDRKQWWRVRNAAGESGFVPNNIVDVLGPGPAGPAYTHTIQKQRMESGPRPADAPLAPSPPPTPAPVPVPLPPAVPAPGPVPTSLPTVARHSSSSSDGSGPAREGQRFRQLPADRRKSQMEEVQDELLQRLTIGRSATHRKQQGPRPSAPAVNITPESPPEAVRAWLQSKGFGPVTVGSLGVLNGAQLFSLNKDELRAVCPEGARVFSQIAVQKAALEDHDGSSELQEIMRRRQEKLSTAASDSGVESLDEGSGH